MRGLLSLDQELRAARLGKGQRSAPSSNRSSELNPRERPWQTDIDQVNETMRELLRVVCGLSGVELPGLPPGLQDDEAPPPRLDIQNLKDRFRNDLEGFSIKTTEELKNRAREQTRAALEAVQNEVGGMVDQVASEFRENLKLPAQIEKLLEPCVEDAEARLANSISEKFEKLVARHEQLVEEKLQGTLSSVHAQIRALERSVQEIRELKAEPAGKPLAEQPVVAELVGRVDELAAAFREKMQDQPRIENLVDPRVEEAAVRLEKSISQRLEDLVAQNEQLIQQKLEGTLRSVHAQISTLEQTVQDVRDQKSELVAQVSAKQNNSAANVEQLLAEHDRLVQGKLQEALSPVQAQISALEQTVQDVRNQKSELVAQATAKQQNAVANVEQLLAEHDRLMQGKLQEALSPVQAQISALEQTVQDVRALKAEPLVQPPAEQPNTAEVEGRIDQLAAEFREKLAGFAQMEKSLEPRLGEVEARLENSVSQKVDHLVARHEELIQQKLQGTLNSVQAQMSVLEQTVQQIRDLRAASAAQLPAEQPAAAADNAPEKDPRGLNRGFKDFLDQSFSRIECSLQNLREIRKAQPAPSTNSNLDYLRKAIPTGSPDMLMRVQQALDHLDQLGSKDPQPAS